MNRRKLLMLPLAAIPAVGYSHFVEPEWLEVTCECVQLPGILPGDPVRLVHVSDLHASRFVSNALIEHGLELALAQKPDMICFTGDYITSPPRYKPPNDVDWVWYTAALRRIAEKVPCLATLGNHDGGAWPNPKGGPLVGVVPDFLKRCGVPLLHNRWQDFRVRSQRVRFVGLGDLWAGQCQPSAAFAGVPNDGAPTVVLTHNPDSKARMADRRWDLMLAGHTHGGQMVMPILGYSPAPVKDRRYIRGLKPWGNRLINVSAGVGNLMGVRFNCRPEVTLIQLDAQV